jgi:hypothetical protein
LHPGRVSSRYDDDQAGSASTPKQVEPPLVRIHSTNIVPKHNGQMLFSIQVIVVEVQEHFRSIGSWDSTTMTWMEKSIWPLCLGTIFVAGA